MNSFSWNAKKKLYTLEDIEKAKAQVMEIIMALPDDIIGEIDIKIKDMYEDDDEWNDDENDQENSDED